jgi:hypothetical protein
MKILVNLVSLSVEWDVNGSDGEFVFVNGGNGEFVFVNGSDGQVVTLWLESGVIGHPSQSEFLAFRGHPIRGSLVGVAEDFLFGFISVIVHFGDDELFLFLRLLTGRVVRLGVAVFSIKLN